jgi:uncharacterized protein
MSTGKTNKYQRRFYRDWAKPKGLYLARIAVKETDLQILTDKPVDKEFVQEKIRSYRWDIENYIFKDARFQASLKPLEVELNARPIIKEMSLAAKQANVGPMAAVAGAVAQFLGKDLMKHGYKDVIIENGGDIFLKTTKALKIGIYAGRSKLWKGLSLRICPETIPLGICTSSGTVGHSLSFGCADSVVILSKNVSLADAVATATCNLVGSKEDLTKALNFARSIKGISGVVIVLRNNLVSWGKVEFVS